MKIKTKILKMKINFQASKRYFKKAIFIILTLLVIGFLGYRFKDKFLAGVVNNEPIFRFQLANRLSSLYGKTVLEDLIVEKLIFQEAKKKVVTVTPEEVNQELVNIQKQLGEKTDLDSLLALQGVKKADFLGQIKIQILLKKMLQNEIAVSEEEITKFLKENQKSMTATTEAGLKKEAKETLEQQKMTEKLNPWVSNLLSKAKILRFVR